MRDKGSYNMSETRMSPDYSYKKCIYWMLIALLTSVFIAICVIASIGYQKNSKVIETFLFNSRKSFIFVKTSLKLFFALFLPKMYYYDSHDKNVIKFQIKKFKKIKTMEIEPVRSMVQTIQSKLFFIFWIA